MGTASLNKGITFMCSILSLSLQKNDNDSNTKYFDYLPFQQEVISPSFQMGGKSLSSLLDIKDYLDYFDYLIIQDFAKNLIDNSTQLDDDFQNVLDEIFWDMI